MKTSHFPPRLLAWLLASLALAATIAVLWPYGVQGAGRQDVTALYADPNHYPAGDTLLGKMRLDPVFWGSELQVLARQPGLPPRLYIDVARAFVYAGASKEQVTQAAELLGRASFSTIDRSEWLYLCQKAAQRGVNAMPCARKLLSEDTFTIHLLGGFDGVGKDYALVFLLLQMPEQLWNREIGDRLWRGADPVGSQVAMLTALFYAVSLRDDAILAKYVDDLTRPAAGRMRAHNLLSQMSSMELTATPIALSQLRQTMALPDTASEEELRESRRRSLKQVSREGLLDLERYTFLIRAQALLRWNDRLRKLD